ncbi:hypothetical protein K7472_02225 [Streptomyces sp. PTM05]|uniref:Uncharacterized protein n=1 Tax=Streptantibioticus parmotrematis TaxID=2873249 RepID=A0ABS7QKE5_9ACTN|nr:hypothetical protein [Streptantibioticus parmotrematis]MBY8883662.1 hypothetical protein [Streptantibioticus parmotrematis]
MRDLAGPRKTVETPRESHPRQMLAARVRAARVPSIDWSAATEKGEPNIVRGEN